MNLEREFCGWLGLKNKKPPWMKIERRLHRATLIQSFAEILGRFLSILLVGS